MDALGRNTKVVRGLSRGGTNASRGTSGISLRGRVGNAVGLHRCTKSSILSVCMTFYETLGRARTHWHNSVSLKER